MKSHSRIPQLLASLLSFVALVSSVATCEAQINYQGRLTDARGLKLPDGGYTIKFTLWDRVTGGAQIWGPYALDGIPGTGHGPQASIADGQFNVVIGDQDIQGASLTARLGTISTPYLQIQVGDGAPITPRQAILPAPMALRANVIPNVTPRDYGAEVNGQLQVRSARSPRMVVEGMDRNNRDSLDLIFTKQASSGDGYQYGYISMVPGRGMHFGNVLGNTFMLPEKSNDAEFFGSINMNIPYHWQYPAWTIRAGEKETPGTYSLEARPYVVESANVGYVFQVSNLGATYDSLTLTGKGRVGIGTKTPQEALDVTGRIRATGDILADGSLYAKSEIYRIIGGTYYRLVGDMRDNGDTRWGIIGSDQRLKRDIAPMRDALGRLAALRPVTFHYTEQGLKHLTRIVEDRCRSASGNPVENERVWAEERAKLGRLWTGLQYGFVAQEMEQVYPDWVTTDEKGFKQIDLRQLSGVLVQGINELSARVQEQAAEIASLERKNAELLRQLTEQSSSAAATQTRLGRIEKALLMLGAPAEDLTTVSIRNP